MLLDNLVYSNTGLVKSTAHDRNKVMRCCVTKAYKIRRREYNEHQKEY